LKYIQPLISALFCSYGLFLIIHFVGHLGVTDLASIVIGLALVALGAIGIALFFKKLIRDRAKTPRR
jgi:hypothetical protein